MKNFYTILLITIVSIINIGCANVQPDNFRGAYANNDTDFYGERERSDKFKYAFRYLLPYTERMKFESKLKKRITHLMHGLKKCKAMVLIA